MGRGGGQERTRISIVVPDSEPLSFQRRLHVNAGGFELTPVFGSHPALFVHNNEPEEHPALVEADGRYWRCRECETSACDHIRGLTGVRSSRTRRVMAQAQWSPAVAEDGRGRRKALAKEDQRTGAFFFRIDDENWRVDRLAQLVWAVHRSSADLTRRQLGYECPVMVRDGTAGCLDGEAPFDPDCPNALAAGMTLGMTELSDPPLFELMLDGRHEEEPTWNTVRLGGSKRVLRARIARRPADDRMRAELTLVRMSADRGKLLIRLEGTTADETHPLMFVGQFARCEDPAHAIGRECFIDRVEGAAWTRAVRQSAELAPRAPRRRTPRRAAAAP